MPPEKIEEIKKLELPKKWQMLQLFSLHLFAGSLAACICLSFQMVEKIITNGFGARAYAIIFATFAMIAILSGFTAGTKGLQLLIQLIRMTKIAKDE